MKIKISPSSLERILACNGSLFAEYNLASTSSKFSLRGNDIHAASQEILTGKKANVTISEDDINIAKDYCDFIKSIPHEELIIEKYHKYEHSNFILHGYPDAIIRNGNHYTIVDLKTGTKAVPAPSTNPQLLAYGIMVRDTYKAEKISVAIFQPGIKYESGDLDFNDLDKLTTDIYEIAKLTELGTINYLPSEHACMYCKAKLICRASMKFLDDSYPKRDAVELLDEEMVAEIYDKIKNLESLSFAIRDRLATLLRQGKHVGHWELDPSSDKILDIPYFDLQKWAQEDLELKKDLNKILKIDIKEFDKFYNTKAKEFDKYRKDNPYPKFRRKK